MTSINTGTTLDVNPTPGRDVRFAATSSESVFTFGNFRLERDREENLLDNTGSQISFTSYYNINNSDSNDFDVLKIINTKENELNLNPEEPTSYAYFGSFYTKVANSINKIVDNFPYPFLSHPISGGITIYDYSHDIIQNYSSFKVAFSSITNQGNIIYVSGRTEQSDLEIDLFNDTNKFSIQLSGESQSTITGDTFVNTIHKIISYNYSINNYFEFNIEGILLPQASTTATTFNYPLYIRPTRKRYGQYKKTISNLEDQLLNSGNFLMPNLDTETYERVTFTWPRTIDGFSPNSYGSEFENYATSILNSSRSVDEEKTNIMLRTMLPENYINLDSENDIYRKLTTTYSEEFDKIKQYIDGLAYAHSISYDGSESVPNKFIVRLANLLGAKLPNAFVAENIVDYLSGEIDNTGNSYEDYNLELWRRMLSNIVWLYKKRGTRDALTFIFKLLGAPDCLFNLEEFIYDVKKVEETITTDATNSLLEDAGGGVDGSGSVVSVLNLDNSATDDLGNPIDGLSEKQDGYPDVNATLFQAGGGGRGDGQAFIQSLGDVYEPTIRVDNLKIKTGNTRNIVNTKEINVDLRPSRAIECDVMDWYEIGYGWWGWGSLSPVFSAMTVPFEWQVEELDSVIPPNMSAMTIQEWVEYIYTANVDPRNRKTLGWQQGHTGIYLDLKKIYITYMLLNANMSNRLTFKKLEKFLNLLERNFEDLVPFFTPATSILNSYGTVYANTAFNRHRFIYRPGINDGSEFKIKLPLVFEPTIQAVDFTVSIENNFDKDINAHNLTATIPKSPEGNVDISNFEVTLPTSLNPNTNVANYAASIFKEDLNLEPYADPQKLTPITYPE
jgi:hypothetical protein